jgi:flagellin
VQAANGTVENRAGLQAEVNQLQAENQRIVENTKFNNVSLLSGSATITFQVGEDAGQTIAVSGLTLTGTGITASADVSTSGGASALLSASGGLNTVIGDVAINRATFGAVQNRFEAVIANLSVSVENLSSSRSRIQDADFAAETAKLTRAQILQQAGVAMLAQANTVPQSALALLR